MILLAGASVLSWTYIFQRGFYLKDIRDSTSAFERKFWSGGDLSQFYAESMKKGEAEGTEAIFQAGFKEFLRLQKQNLPADWMMENVKRAMHAAQTREQDKLETNLPWLATVGSTSPYLGLFGTVWG